MTRNSQIGIGHHLFALSALLLAVTACQQTASERYEPIAGEATSTVVTIANSPESQPATTARVTATMAAPTIVSTMVPAMIPSPTMMALTPTIEGWQKTITPIPGSQPLPTIAHENREAFYLELMATNGGCDLPCWWGFELGRSTMADVRRLYERFVTEIVGTNLNDGKATAIEVKLDYIDSPLRSHHSYFAQDDIITSIYVEVGRAPEYQIEKLLVLLGSPAEVWIWTHPDTFGGMITMNLVMSFPDKGIFAYYELEVQKSGDYIQTCFNNAGLAILYFWLPEVLNPNGDKTLAEMVHPNSIFTVVVSHPIQDVSNWDVAQFYDTLVDPDHTDCLQTPADIWPGRL